MTQSLSLNASYTGPDGSSVSSTYGTFFLGRYRVVDEIGVGGMASVHLARLDGAGGFQKWVAIKRIHPHLVEDDQFVHMFLDEARIAARINHANVAQVYELGEGEGNYWIAMEYLHGEPLREVMRQIEDGAPLMAYEIAAKVVADAAEGLHAAHDLRGKNGEALGLVHRDVTPHNIFVTYEGQIKVVDFGIAKVAGRLSSTRAGTLKGKLAYMSPEQVRGAEIDRRTDIFALGVVLWELTTNQRLFRTDSDLETLEKVQACQITPPSRIRRDYPPQLEQIVLRALARDPNQRFQTARDFSRELQKFLLSRGMFIGPEHVSEYVHRLLGDRIRKRDEHLRWAAEVTQTINIDEFQQQQGYSEVSAISMVSQNSEVMPAAPPRGPQSLPSPGPGPRSIETGLPPLPSLPTGPLPSVRKTLVLPSLGAVPSPLPTFGAAPPPVFSPLPSPHAAYDDDDDENIQTIVAPAKSLLIDDSAPTVALAHQPGAVVNPMTGAPYQPALPAAGAPPPVPPANYFTPPPVAAPSSYSAPPVSYSTPQSHGHIAVAAPAISETPTIVPTQPQALPPGLTPQQILLLRDPTLQLPSTQGKQIGLAIVASVAGTLTIVGVAFFLLRGEGRKSNHEEDSGAKTVATAPVTASTVETAPAVSTTVAVVQPPPTPTPPTTDASPTTPSSLPTAKTSPPPQPTHPTSSPPPPKPEKKEVPPAAAPAGGTGFLTVVCRPACDSVVVKGRNLGPSPVMKVAFPAGTYSVVLKRSGSPNKATSVTIVADKTTPLRMNMLPHALTWNPCLS